MTIVYFNGSINNVKLCVKDFRIWHLDLLINGMHDRINGFFLKNMYGRFAGTKLILTITR